MYHLHIITLCVRFPMTLLKAASEVSRKIDRSFLNKDCGLPITLKGYILFCSFFAKVQEHGLDGVHKSQIHRCTERGGGGVALLTRSNCNKIGYGI